ncbi:MAG: T9SS type A sorting domain-containing protein [Candidatus Nomurabacteria bacterium]|nr:T9SS type A sorting domain-containing protein [Candidatus Nomurabacteria bacterium]
MKKVIMVIGMLLTTLMTSTAQIWFCHADTSHTIVPAVTANSVNTAITFGGVPTGHTSMSFVFNGMDLTLNQPLTAQTVPNSFSSTDTAGVFNAIFTTTPGHSYSLHFDILIGYPSGFNPGFIIVNSDTMYFTADCISPVINVTAPTTTICNGGSVLLTASGATNFLLDGVPFTGTSVTVSPASTTTYTVTGTSDACSGTTIKTITVNSAPNVTVSPTQTICRGSSVTLYASGGTSYNWPNGSHYDSLHVTPSYSTNYVVSIILGTCPNVLDTIHVIVNQLPVIATSSNQTICSGQTVTLIANGASSYSLNGIAMTGNNFSVSPTTTTTYTVVGTDANGCSNSHTTTVTVTGAPTVNVSNSTICAGQTTTLTATGANTYLWSTGSISHSISVNPISTTTYTVTGTTSGCSGTSTVTVTVNPIPVVSITTPSQSICPGSSVTLYASGGTSYVWSTGGNLDSIAVSSAGTYTVQAVNGTCTSSNTASVTITVSSIPIVTVSNASPSICLGQTTTLIANGASSYSLNGIAMTGNNFSVSPTTTTTYTVVGTNSCGGTASTSTIVTVNGIPNAVISANGPTSFCSGGAVTLTSPSSITGSNAWYDGSTVLGTTSAITVNANHVVVLVVTINGCSNTAPSMTVTVNPLPPVPTISAGGPIIFCAYANSNVVLSATGGPYNYLWNNTDTNPSIVVTTTGNYGVTITDANGCSSTSTLTSVTVKSLPAANITPLSGTTFCAGQGVNLQASPGASYLWSNGSTSQILNAQVSGVYTVTVTGMNGCSATSTSENVSANPLPTVFITVNGNSQFCEGTSLQLIANGSSSNTYAWSNFTNGQVTNVTQSGTYTVTVTNPSTGCSNTAVSPIVIQLQAPTVFPQSVGGGVVVAHATGGTAPYIYNWNPGGTGQSMTYITSTNYTVTAIDANGCQGSFSSQVFVGIEEYQKGKELKIFPNPSSADFTIVLENQNNDVNLLNMLGQTVQEYKNVKDGNFVLFGSDLANGVYFIRVKNSDGISNQKVIKE